LRGKVILLTFLDPVCTGCDLLAKEVQAAGTLLDPSGQQVEEVAITATPLHASEAYITAFDRLRGFADVPNWLFLTGPVINLELVWHQYELVLPKMMTGMTVHSDVVFIIDGTGRLRAEVWDGPGTGTPASQSAFAVLLSDTARHAMR
jgi:cytochrome oxidase Cu insertion factor (SCO1/SenC/PrrC family)